MDLEYATTVITVCCILHNFLIEEGDIGEDTRQKSNNLYLTNYGQKKVQE
jgi:hypothetical protein